MLCVDATNGKEQNPQTIHNSNLRENLDIKWRISKEVFFEKLRKASEDDYEQLWKDIDSYWKKRDRNS